MLGVRDRHKDNMMIKDGSTFLHIDFGFLFNKTPIFDSMWFPIPIELYKKMQERNIWDKFA